MYELYKCKAPESPDVMIGVLYGDSETHINTEWKELVSVCTILVI